MKIKGSLCFISWKFYQVCLRKSCHQWPCWLGKLAIHHTCLRLHLQMSSSCWSHAGKQLSNDFMMCFLIHYALLWATCRHAWVFTCWNRFDSVTFLSYLSSTILMAIYWFFKIDVLFWFGFPWKQTLRLVLWASALFRGLRQEALAGAWGSEKGKGRWPRVISKLVTAVDSWGSVCWGALGNRVRHA